MISTSDGSRPSADEFLQGKLRQYALTEDMIARMQRYRIPTVYQEAAGGQGRQNTSSQNIII
jgi:hypothetical protein